MLQLCDRIRHRALRTRLRAPLDWYRHRGLAPDDLFLGSFERSGSTWLRFLLYELLTGGSAEFENYELAIPYVGGHSRTAPLLPGGRRLIHTHHRYRPEYRRAIYLVRDVRDVLLSHHARARALGHLAYYSLSGLDDYVLSFLRGKQASYGSWQDHVRLWLDAPIARNRNLLVVRYEDMRRNTEEVLIQILDFLGVAATGEAVRNAVENNSIERMREKEARTTILSKAGGDDARFVRRGLIGGWREKLSKAQLQLIRKYTGDVLARMGYLRGCAPVVDVGDTLPRAKLECLTGRANSS